MDSPHPNPLERRDLQRRIVALKELSFLTLLTCLFPLQKLLERQRRQCVVHFASHTISAPILWVIPPFPPMSSVTWKRKAELDTITYKFLLFRSSNPAYSFPSHGCLLAKFSKIVGVGYRKPHGDKTNSPNPTYSSTFRRIHVNRFLYDSWG